MSTETTPLSAVKVEPVVSFKQFSLDAMNEHAIAKDGTIVGSLSFGSGGKYFFWPKHNCGPLSSEEMMAIADRMDSIGS